MNFLIKSFQAFEGKKIIITGGNGYIGSSLSESLSSFTENICIHSRVKKNNIKENKKFTYLYGDLFNEEVWDSIIDFEEGVEKLLLHELSHHES